MVHICHKINGIISSSRIVDEEHTVFVAPFIKKICMHWTYNTDESAYFTGVV